MTTQVPDNDRPAAATASQVPDARQAPPAEFYPAPPSAAAPGYWSGTAPKAPLAPPSLLRQHFVAVLVAGVVVFIAVCALARYGW